MKRSCWTHLSSQIAGRLSSQLSFLSFFVLSMLSAPATIFRKLNLPLYLADVFMTPVVIALAGCALKAD